MKRYRKRILITAVLFIVVGLSTQIFAAFWGYEFVYGGNSKSTRENWYHILDNPSTQELSASLTVKRVMSASCTTSVQVCVTGLVAKVTAALEVTIGTSKEITWTDNFRAGPWQKVRCSGGSFVETPWGYQDYWVCWVKTSRTKVSLAGSTGGYTKQQTVSTYPH